MNTTGGTDIDWVIEHRSGFIVIENKTFSKNWIDIPVGQMLTFEQMYKKLNSDGRCHFLIFGLMIMLILRIQNQQLSILI